MALLQELDLTLAATLETHIHADHLTSACRLRSLTGCKVAYPDMDGLACADIGVSELDPLAIGALTLKPLFTPGHTDTHHSYLLDFPGSIRVMTGDALLIDGCGRTDFQNGDAETLYSSVHEKLFSLPVDTLVFPAHDYDGRHVSSVAQEKERNPRLGKDKTLAEFIEIMGSLDLPYPERMDEAVPANKMCGDCPDMNDDDRAMSSARSVQG